MIQKLCEEFDENFTEDDIKSKWNVLLTHERLEGQVEKVTRSSGVGKMTYSILIRNIFNK